MNVQGKRVLITGGASGIGFALAQRFHRDGAQVIVCGRRPEALAEASAQLHGVQTLVCDVAEEANRQRLFEEVSAGGLDVLVNNAGVQVRPPTFDQPQDWQALQNELRTNVEAPIHLATLFIPVLLKSEAPVLINVTSGLAFVPIAWMPTYCASKAAMHSFTLSLRKQLEHTKLKVVEMAPPAVDTDLGGKGLHTFGVPLDEYADFAYSKLLEGDEEFGYGTAERSRRAGREELDAIFEQINSGQH